MWCYLVADVASTSRLEVLATDLGEAAQRIWCREPTGLLAQYVRPDITVSSRVGSFVKKHDDCSDGS
jgi:hypothetical protein